MEHTIAAGESLSTIAKAYGLPTWQALYNAPENQAFRLKFPNPNVVSPGARITIPNAAPKAGATLPPPPSSRTTPAKSANTVPSAPAKVPAPKTNPKGDPKAPYDPSKEPAALTADIIKSTAFEFPGKFVEFLCWALKVPEAEFKPALEFLKKRQDGVEALIELYKAYQAYQNGNMQAFACSMLKGTGKLISALPEKLSKRAIHGIASMVRRIPKFGPLADIFDKLFEVGALPPLLTMLSGLVAGGKDGAKDVRDGGKDLVEALADKPDVAISIAPRIFQFLESLIPDRLKAKLLGKMAGRKVPVVGTIIVGLMDGYSIICDPTDWKRWAGLGSTVAGLVPFAGTAVSVLIDIGILVGTIAENLNDLKVDVSKV